MLIQIILMDEKRIPCLVGKGPREQMLHTVVSLFQQQVSHNVTIRAPTIYWSPRNMYCWCSVKPTNSCEEKNWNICTQTGYEGELVSLRNIWVKKVVLRVAASSPKPRRRSIMCKKLIIGIRVSGGLDAIVNGLQCFGGRRRTTAQRLLWIPYFLVCLPAVKWGTLIRTRGSHRRTGRSVISRGVDKIFLPSCKR